MDGLSGVAGEIFPAKTLPSQHLDSDFSFTSEVLLSSAHAYWSIIFCYLKVKGAQLYFLAKMELWDIMSLMMNNCVIRVDIINGEDIELKNGIGV